MKRSSNRRVCCFGWLCVSCRSPFCQLNLYRWPFRRWDLASWTFTNRERYWPRHVLWTGESACSSIKCGCWRSTTIVVVVVVVVVYSKWQGKKTQESLLLPTVGFVMGNVSHSCAFHEYGSNLQLNIHFLFMFPHLVLKFISCHSYRIQADSILQKKKKNIWFWIIRTILWLIFDCIYNTTLLQYLA